MMCVISDSLFDAGELRRYVKEVEKCERVSVKRNKEELGKKGFVKESVGRKTTSSAYCSVLYRKGILTVLR